MNHYLTVLGCEAGMEGVARLLAPASLATLLDGKWEAVQR